jgi:tetratricopeptide (TPR) repeat protein
MAAARLSLGRLLVVRGRLDEAEAQLERAAEIFARFVGDDTPDYAAAQLGLGELAEARGELDRALAHYTRSRDIMTGLLGPRHPYSLRTRLSALNVQRRLGRDFGPDAYASLAADAEAAGGSARSVRSDIACDRARHAMERDRPEAALDHARLCLELREALGLGGWRLTEARALIAFATGEQGGASAEFEALVRELAEQMNPDHPLVTWFARAGAT